MNLTDRNTPQRSATGENGWLVDFDSTRFFATNEAEAKQKAAKWADSAAAAVGGITERTWLQVLLDGKSHLFEGV